MSATDLVGTALPPAAVVVERGAVAAFAEAVTDTSPVYQRADAARAAGFDAIPAPPTFTFAARLLGAFPDLQPARPEGALEVTDVIAALRTDGGLILHAEQEFTYHRPVLTGSTVHLTGEVEDVRVTTNSRGQTMTFVRIRTDTRDDAGELLVTEVMTLLHRA
ncbi:MaoC family dehydratase N-terminal domain-containing protein [Frankia sp. CNm7]|uniref:MaoC family dehydratase N-terminal domain-containing protein n=1 Tax=Frankia nepalensis TaxID=1836974 RepID=A0A937RE11_9ACTN|nr:MaoC family dehydratase N-terminal domain-containing protein [Frankia nepalensis]MBL7500033.1 MaoC family dehydratase N-terminal domain-containing protein [Frankia nepalensis]MBL7511538.1 MaoC family dehydratase N-terminal domain-containing protein [Frankia nepalensis]MBL7521002.1 MaoC family dehydratase N-terminal domain-containing protein [Frankia nepalensis]MBL7628522.1 MaoC family dehydratase N-terminal domain-containing protein [Frankia nepalensis]